MVKFGELIEQRMRRHSTQNKKIGYIVSCRLPCYVLGIFLQATLCVLYVGCMPEIDFDLYDDNTQGGGFRQQPRTGEEQGYEPEEQTQKMSIEWAYNCARGWV